MAGKVNGLSNDQTNFKYFLHKHVYDLSPNALTTDNE